jgi:hypothetical protein
MQAVLEMMARLSPEGQETVQTKVQEMMKEIGDASTREGLVRHFLKARDQYAIVAKMRSVSTTNSTNVKPPSASGQSSLKASTPITVNRLVVNTTHRSRHFCGKVAVADSFHRIAHIYMLLEDCTGDLIQVCVYNTSKVYELGESLLIMEPFYKMGSADGLPLIRVDRPSEVVSWHFPATCLEWKELGNEFIRGSDNTTALHCYQTALTQAGIPETRPVLAVLYSNLALCHNRLGFHSKAVWFTGTAVYLDPDNVKTWYRLVDSLAEVSPRAAREVLKEAPEVPELRKLRNKLGADTQPNPSDWQVTFTGVTAWSHLSILFSTAPDPEPTTTETDTFPLDWSQVRRRAATHFKKEQYFEAIHRYVQEIGSMKDTITDIAVVTSNMAAAHIMEGNFADAMLLSTVSAMLNKKNVKPWLRRSRVLESAAKDVIALEYLKTISNEVKGEKGGSWEGCESFLEICNEEVRRVRQKIDKKAYVKEVGSTSTEQQLKDRDACQSRYKVEEQDADEYIVKMEAMLSGTRFIFLSMACSKDPTPVHCLLKTLSPGSVPGSTKNTRKRLGGQSGWMRGGPRRSFIVHFLIRQAIPGAWLCS